MLEQSQLNLLELDIEFIKQFMNLPDPEQKEYWDSWLLLCIERLNTRVYLVHEVISEMHRADASKTKLNMLEENTWNKVKFSRISLMIIENLKNKKTKDACLAKFSDNG